MDWLLLWSATTLWHISAEPLLLTPLVNDGQLEEARHRSSITDTSRSPTRSYGHSGFFTVPAARRPDRNNHIFFWYQPCTECDSTSTAPFMIWLQGGPGSPGTFGSLAEIGQFYVDGAITIKERCYSWCRKQSCLFVDQPVQTGFSFQTDLAGRFHPDEIYYTEHSADAMAQVYEVLMQFRKVFHETRTAPFYVAGESYGGKYTAHMGLAIVNGNKANTEDVINFVGLAVGDPLIDWKVQMPMYPDTLHRLGLISGKEKDDLAVLFGQSVQYIKDGDCNASFQLWNSFWNDDGRVGWENCGYAKMTGSTHTMNALLAQQPDDWGRQAQYLSIPFVKDIFHISGSPSTPQYDEGGAVYDSMVTSGDFCSRTSEIYTQLFLEEGIDLLIYTANQDPLLGAPPSEAAVLDIFKNTTVEEALHQAEKHIWRLDSDDPSSLAGYAHCVPNPNFAGKRFCFSVVRNAGHIIPYDQEKFAFDLIHRFIGNRSYGPEGDDPASLEKTCSPLEPVICRSRWESPIMEAAPRAGSEVASTMTLSLSAMIVIGACCVLFGLLLGVAGHQWLIKRTMSGSFDYHDGKCLA